MSSGLEPQEEVADGGRQVSDYSWFMPVCVPPVVPKTHARKKECMCGWRQNEGSLRVRMETPGQVELQKL